MTESQILSAIRLALGREPDLTLWRLSMGLTTSPDGHRHRAGLSVNGGADTIGILSPGGRFFALEVKTPEHLGRILSAMRRGKVSSLSASDQAQIQFLALVRRRGGFGAFVASEEEAREALQRARGGESE